MTPLDPSLARLDGQPGAQATLRRSTGFGGLETQVAWNPIPMSNMPMDNTRIMTMPSLTSQGAFIPSIPTVSGTSSFDPLVNPTWTDSGAFLPQRTPTNPGSSRDSTMPAANPRGPVSESHSGQRIRQHPACDFNNTFEPIIPPQRHSGHLSEAVPNRTKHYSAGGWDGDGSNQTSIRTGITPSERTPWPGESQTEMPDDDPDNRATDDRPEQHTDPRSGGTASSSAQPRQAQDLRARNRRAATKCRAKAKAATAELEATEREMELKHQELSAQATSLQDEVLALKNELLLHGNCDCEPIQQYLTNAAKNIIGGRMG
ncbi:hypothetical protein VPNG_06193 [Cytospora leucostoma]|uniref:BZIP domain-containing protein n=1 Tax=Cytospora leucostoma TaxID=1230097 RepID=A0A423WYG8_9PEZI|nr:hypothetical protein VPNG_06193 [Cytospora leucostoma]